MLLILLVGQNPLPNWVVFQALRLPDAPADLRPERVLLVHSRKTAEVAERLAPRMTDLGARVRTLELTNPRDGVAIKQELLGELASHHAGVPVHLNYTGGTKEMAVSAFAALSGGPHKDGLLCSYLDVERHRLRFDRRTMWPGDSAPDLRAKVHVPLDLLLGLHGRKLEGRDGHSLAAPLWPGAAEAIWRLWRSSDDAAARYRAWADEQFAGPSGRRRKDAEFRAAGGFMLPPEDLSDALVAAIRSDLRLEPADERVTWEQARSALDGLKMAKVYETTAKFFRGIWLEDWFWLRSRECLPRQDSWALHHSVTASPTDVSKGAKNSEIDVLLLRGYQPFVFSCTTDPNIVKEKALEVIHRAQQYGGEEARPIVVAPLEQGKAEEHLYDIESDFGAGSNLRIWGLEELDHLDQTWAALLREEGLA